MEISNKETLLNNVIENINKNKSSKAKPVKEILQKIERKIVCYKDKILNKGWGCRTRK